LIYWKQIGDVRHCDFVLSSTPEAHKLPAWFLNSS